MNGWTIAEDEFAVWEAILPGGNAVAAARWRDRCLKLGKQTGIYVRVDEPNATDANSLAGTFETTAAYRLPVGEPRIRTSHQWADLVRRERCDDLEFAEMPLLQVCGPNPDSDAEQEPDYSPRFIVCVNSDIWFPFVQDIPRVLGRAFDNRALAALHTPRFNQFLVGLQQITVELGGTWQLQREDVQDDYLVQLSDSGIRLDGPSDTVAWPQWVKDYAWGKPAAALNKWCTTRDDLASWRVEVPLSAGPKPVLQWLDAVLKAGEQYEVYTVEAAPKISYTRAADGPIWDWVSQRFESSGELHCCEFAVDSNFEASTHLAYFDKDGALAEATNIDWWRVLANACPYAHKEEIPRTRVLTITGYQLQLVASKSRDVSKGTHASLTITLASDIWFPWVRNHLYRPTDRQLVDNRALAALHTPRFNQFLAAVRNATTAIGGTCTLDPDHWRMRGQVCNDGVILNAPRPKIPTQLEVPT